MRHTLRPYQESAVDRCVALLREGQNVVLVSPVGSGKTSMGTAIIERFGQPTLWNAHRRELIYQAQERLALHGLPTGLIMAGAHTTPGALVQVASIQTLARRQIPACGLVAVDEVHHFTAQNTYAALMNIGVPVIGLTATPWRLDGHGLRDAGFTEMVVAATPSQLEQMGFLVRPRTFVPAEPDLTGVRPSGHDYNVSDASKAMRRATVTGNVVEHYRKHANGLRALLFAVDVEHSTLMRERFESAGIPAGHVDASTGVEQRAGAFEALRTGRILVLCNCQIATEGIDLPWLEAIIVCRPTKSLSLHIQMIGRVVRPDAGKRGCVVLDHAGNYGRHGLITDPIEWSLESDEPEPKRTTRRCWQCETVYDLSLPACPSCGASPLAGDSDPRKKSERDGHLVEVDGGQTLFGTLDATPPSVATQIDPWTERSTVWRTFFYSIKPLQRAHAAFQRRYGAYPFHVGDRLVDRDHVLDGDMTMLRLQWAEFARSRKWPEQKVQWWVTSQEANFLGVGATS